MALTFDLQQKSISKTKFLDLILKSIHVHICNCLSQGVLKLLCKCMLSLLHCSQKCVLNCFIAKLYGVLNLLQWCSTVCAHQIILNQKSIQIFENLLSRKNQNYVYVVVSGVYSASCFIYINNLFCFISKNKLL